MTKNIRLIRSIRIFWESMLVRSKLKWFSIDPIKILLDMDKLQDWRKKTAPSQFTGTHFYVAILQDL